MSTVASAGGRSVPFDPKIHGFNFANSFQNDVVKEVDLRTGGLCGGMVYTATDYYLARKPVPRQDYRPATNTALQKYIYSRQVQSLLPNLDKWTEREVNPFGSRDKEFFRWGLSTEFDKLRRSIDTGKPTPLGVIDTEGKAKHQILAIGYTTDSKNKLESIQVYDPNFPNKTTTMRPNLAKSWFEYDGSSKKWRTYFVDTKYRASAPPSIVTPKHADDEKIRELVVEFQTGDDDLRGGQDNVDLILHLRNGKTIRRSKINLGARWLTNYTEYASVVLPSPIARADIAKVEFVTSFRGGISGDNWDTKKINVTYYAGANRRTLVASSSFFRFTGDRRSLVLTVPATDTPVAKPGQVTRLRVTIKTGNDDLRGGGDDVNIKVLFRDGSHQMFRTVNQRKRWGDKETHDVWLDLQRPRDRADIIGMTLTTTFKGGVFGDNWNMSQLRVTPHEGKKGLDAYTNLTGKPLKRFTGDSQNYTVRW
ncbi:hypothetical protein [Paraliomyxa miuraensis]|uniref:hypothetical protein n=1 Tax=Paraliomyxa miuraensis TaxID=376150 RepID=UPI0022562638|nr:hypothetical protein [Paraliomyxa miuraensis]MCX4239420.1 hypothetical protein [Paraliomyxa miuraensis]